MIGPAAGPIIIAHRGASGERPEHTLAAYIRAIEQGADYIEPDLVISRDGVLIIRHENEIGGTTNIADHPEFFSRRTSKLVDGREKIGWFAEDFTLTELKTLRARERLPQLRPTNNSYLDEAIATLDEVLALVKTAPRRIGIYPETKHPSYFAALGLAMERPLIDALAKAGFSAPDDPVFIQSFETANLKDLRAMTSLRLVQLIDQREPPHDQKVVGTGLTVSDMISPGGLRDIAAYADAIGPNKLLIEPRDAAGRSLPPTSLVADAHAAGLLVHAWTFRQENIFLALDDRVGEDPAMHGNGVSEYRRFFRHGVDGVFSDFRAIARYARHGAR